jgi:phage terminase large subunit-like protein
MGGICHLCGTLKTCGTFAALSAGDSKKTLRFQTIIKYGLLVVETNQGGDIVGAVIATVDPDVPVKPVRARRGKWLRAEPVAALYHQGKVRHAARFPELEDEMCDFAPDGLSSGRSPDRVDALVWAINELMPRNAARPRIRDF